MYNLYYLYIMYYMDDIKVLHFKLTNEMHKAFKLRAAEQGISMQRLITDLIESGINNTTFNVSKHDVRYKGSVGEVTGVVVDEIKQAPGLLMERPKKQKLCPHGNPIGECFDKRKDRRCEV